MNQIKHDVVTSLRYLEVLSDKLSSNSAICFTHDFSELQYYITLLQELRDTLSLITDKKDDSLIRKSYDIFIDILDYLNLFDELAEISSDTEVQMTIESVIEILSRHLLK